ncbi:unnamed protein product [Durusdinium trenchii]|uniref:F-box domain-containing protein n=1 Tax=Durusdinium trenchii TaxID=1381693 RepID=A0ABP0KBK7_9DINO
MDAQSGRRRSARLQAAQHDTPQREHDTPRAAAEEDLPWSEPEELPPSPEPEEEWLPPAKRRKQSAMKARGRAKELRRKARCAPSTPLDPVRLPEGVWSLVFEFLTGSDLVNLSGTCRHFDKHPFDWKALFEETEFAESRVALQGTLPEGKTYKAMLLKLTSGLCYYCRKPAKRTLYDGVPFCYLEHRNKEIRFRKYAIEVIPSAELDMVPCERVRTTFGTTGTLFRDEDLFWFYESHPVIIASREELERRATERRAKEAKREAKEVARLDRVRKTLVAKLGHDETLLKHPLCECLLNGRRRDTERVIAIVGGKGKRQQKVNGLIAELEPGSEDVVVLQVRSFVDLDGGTWDDLERQLRAVSARLADFRALNTETQDMLEGDRELFVGESRARFSPRGQTVVVQDVGELLEHVQARHDREKQVAAVLASEPKQVQLDTKAQRRHCYREFASDLDKFVWQGEPDLDSILAEPRQRWDRRKKVDDLIDELEPGSEAYFTRFTRDTIWGFVYRNGWDWEDLEWGLRALSARLVDFRALNTKTQDMLKSDRELFVREGKARVSPRGQTVVVQDVGELLKHVQARHDREKQVATVLAKEPSQVQSDAKAKGRSYGWEYAKDLDMFVWSGQPTLESILAEPRRCWNRQKKVNDLINELEPGSEVFFGPQVRSFVHRNNGTWDDVERQMRAVSARLVDFRALNTKTQDMLENDRGLFVREGKARVSPKWQVNGKVVQDVAELLEVVKPRHDRKSQVAKVLAREPSQVQSDAKAERRHCGQEFANDLEMFVWLGQPTLESILAEPRRRWDREEHRREQVKAFLRARDPDTEDLVKKCVAWCVPEQDPMFATPWTHPPSLGDRRRIPRVETPWDQMEAYLQGVLSR